MEMRVEQLSAQADVSVDTIRYYQSKGLLEAPRREGRIAWYGSDHVVRLSRIRTLQQRGFTLATIARLVSGDLDAADEALLGHLSGLPPVAQKVTNLANATVTDPLSSGGRQAPDSTADSRTYSVVELAEVTGMPLALLKAIEAEGLLIPTRVAGQERYTDEDVAASRAGLLMLEWGIPLPELLDLARRHNEATDAVARQAVDLFARHVREPLRQGSVPDALVRNTDETVETGIDDTAVDGLLQAYASLLPAVNTLVGHHFARTLVKVALEYVEQVGSARERQAVWDRIEADGASCEFADADRVGGR